MIYAYIAYILLQTGNLASKSPKSLHKMQQIENSKSDFTSLQSILEQKKLLLGYIMIINNVSTHLESNFGDF